MNKRSKKAAKSNINTRKGTNVACPTPRQHLPKENKKTDKDVEASIAHHGVVLSGHGAVVNYKTRRIQANLYSTDTLLHTGSCLADTGAWSTKVDKL
ncbi:hypothetical protein HanIR_Chr13g0663991 [Helianthus annuus]|nr:hypothetical protein HanIR_Chr13g0663991 [Helianthus annuus]